jgi:DNA-binding response OmpR family regulator
MPYHSVALIVSADPQVRRLIACSLDAVGCRTLAAATHDEGVECAGRNQVDWVIVDVSWSDAAEALTRRLRSSHPSVKVLYLVGRRHPIFMGSAAIEPGNAYLRKPFALSELCGLVAGGLTDRLTSLSLTTASLN